MTSSTILGDTGIELNVIGDKFKADGFAGGDGLHTVGIYLNDFIGRVFIQGSLAIVPLETDWFNIVLDGEVNSFLQFETQTDLLILKNFTGNFVWVRAKVDRSHLVSPDPLQIGRVTKIIMNK